MMRSIFVAFIVTLPALGQQTLSTVPQACGDPKVSMAVKLDDSQHRVAQPEPGKALIYFIQESGTEITLGYPTTKIGTDGQWRGANKKNSWFSISVDPGEHHICVAIQSSMIWKRVELAHLKAEAGKVYSYRSRIILSGKGPVYLEFAPVDTDEAAYLISNFPMATSKSRK